MSDRHPALARYNAWANHKLYRAVEALPDADYRADRGAFFRSLHGTLNHLLVTDRLWMARFAREKPPLLRLDAILYDDLAALYAARGVEDTRIIGFVDALDGPALARTFVYTRATALETYEQQLGPALDHLFNHQTHHRGQAHAILTGLGVDAPSLDLARFYGEVGFGGLKRIA